MTGPALKKLVSEGKALAEKIAKLKPLEKQLDAIKDQLREAAGKKDCEFAGIGGDKAVVKFPADTIARTVDSSCLEQVTQLAGTNLLDLFKLSPAKGDYASFEINALKTIGAVKAAQLDELLRVPSTARVSFA